MALSDRAASLQRYHFAVALYHLGGCPGDGLLVYRVEAGTAGDLVLLEVVSWIYQVVALEAVYLVVLVGAGNCVVPARTDADSPDDAVHHSYRHPLRQCWRGLHQHHRQHRRDRHQPLQGSPPFSPQASLVRRYPLTSAPI